MRQYALVIIYASNDEVKELANRKLGDVGLEITKWGYDNLACKAGFGG
jgi:hypothetical protein